MRAIHPRSLLITWVEFTCLFMMAAAGATGAAAADEPVADGRYFGEPVRLLGRAIYFTSWQFVRPGAVGWEVRPDPSNPRASEWLKGDGGEPAVFSPRDMPRGVRLVAQPAEKAAFTEGQFAAQVLDQGKYKAWRTVNPYPEPEPFSGKDRILPGFNGHLSYAESEDGTRWETPKLGLFEYAGNRENSLVFRGDIEGSTRGWHGGSVFVDPSSQEERFKMLYLGIITDAEWAAFDAKYPGESDTMARRPDVGGFRCVVGVFGTVSPDGIHWKRLEEPLMIQHADTVNTCYYDQRRKLYVAHVRVWQVGEREPGHGSSDSTSWIDVGRRAIGRSVSKDFRHFSKPEVVLATGADEPPSHVYYTNAKTTLPGCPDQHVMFPWIWEMERDGGSVWLYSSGDGWTWSRVPGGPVLAAGRPGESDGGFVVCSGNLLEYPGDRWAIGYEGAAIPHKYPGRDIAERKGLFPGLKGASGLATWTKGRLVALQANDEGEFATVFVVPPTDRLRVNAIVPPTGYLRVAIRGWGSDKDMDGRSFAECDRIVGDSIATRLSWKGEERIPHEGRPICLRVRMKQAELFGFEFD